MDDNRTFFLTPPILHSPTLALVFTPSFIKNLSKQFIQN